MYPRLRPHRLQRRTTRVEYLGVFLLLAIWASVAIKRYSKGNFRLRKSASPSASVLAVVAIVTRTPNTTSV